VLVYRLHPSFLFDGLRLRQPIMLLNIPRLPWVIDPHIWHCARSNIPTLIHHLLRQMPLLRLVLVMQHEDAEPGLLPTSSGLLCGGRDILLQFLYRILERRPRVVDLVDDEHALANQVGHLERAQVEPLCACDFGAGNLHLAIAVGTKLFIEREADGLDGDVGRARLLEEGAQDTGGDVAAAADGDHEVGGEIGEDARGGILTEFVDLLAGV